MDALTTKYLLASRAARQIADLGDRQSLIFRRFDRLAIQTILDLHIRLSEIDSALDSDLANSPPSAELRRLLGEYYSAIHTYSEILNLSRPPVGYVRDLISALHREENEEPWKLWNEMKNRPFSDLVAVSAFDDPLTRFFSSTPFMFCFINVRESIIKGQTVIDLTRIRRFVAAFQAFISIGFLVGAMWGLEQVHHMPTRLGMVTGFVGWFCIWVALTTGIPRRDVFAATAAYAAVLVVYVGTTGSESDTEAACSCLVELANRTISQ